MKLRWQFGEESDGTVFAGGEAEDEGRERSSSVWLVSLGGLGRVEKQAASVDSCGFTSVVNQVERIC